MLQALLRSDNPILRSNVFCGLVFLGGRNEDIGRAMWQASARVMNVSGEAGGLLREVGCRPLNETGCPCWVLAPPACLFSFLSRLSCCLS